jgi:hypothetical protein
MPDPDYKALCAELVQDIEEWIVAVDHCPPSSSALVQRARAALSQPEPVAPTQGAAVAVYTEVMVVHNCQTLGEMAEHFAHAVLARWGTPANYTSEGD